MPQPNTPQNRNYVQEEEIDLREQLELYLKKWPWFVAGVLICLFVAFLYLRYSTPVYNTVATIIIKDEESKALPGGLSEFADMGMLGGMSTSSIENEIGILKSKRLLTNVGKKLQLHVQVYGEGEVLTVELYEDRPFNVQILEYNEEKLVGLELEPFHVDILNAEKYLISNEDIDFEKEVSFGTPVELPFAKIILTPNFEAGAEYIDEELLLNFGILDRTVAGYRNRIQVNLTDENSTLIELSLEDAVRAKAQDILNSLVYQYNQEAIEDKNQVSLNTANFIEDRLAIISAELDSVETGKQRFKTENQITDIQAESQLYIENASEFRKEQLEVETQLELANSMIDYLKDDQEGRLLPANLGFDDEGLAASIQSYNELVLERNRILSGSTERNPVIINLNSQIEQIRASVMQSLLNLRNSLLISQEDLRQRELAIKAQIADVPATEKQFRSILRQQNIKEALYLFLLQKREETSLALAATAPKAKIVDRAYSTPEPVAPKTKIVLLGSLILGLLLPFSVLYTRNLLNNKIRSQADIEAETKEIPVVGEVPQLHRKQEELVTGNDRSVLAESFRILHTNLQYLLVNAAPDTGGNTIFVTSTVKGEGKTFVAFNLAITLANAGKKVLVVGADLRNPQLQRFETGARKLQGVSDYLVNENLQVQDLVEKSSLHKNLDILASGNIPPNPSELLRQGKIGTLFAELRSDYHYVIVDTAPALLVTDTFLINKYADLTLYVVRAGYTEKKLVNFAVDAKRDGKLHDIGFVLNSVKTAHYGYGNKYGYAYGEERKTFWENIKSKF